MTYITETPDKMAVPPLNPFAEELKHAGHIAIEEILMLQEKRDEKLSNTCG
jgi:hypothetical protein